MKKIDLEELGWSPIVFVLDMGTFGMLSYLRRLCSVLIWQHIPLLWFLQKPNTTLAGGGL